MVSVGYQLQAAEVRHFFIIKIPSALRWAAQLRANGTLAVAVFWMASEDHDFEEIARTHAPGGPTFVWTPERLEEAPVGRIAWDADAENDWQTWCQSASQSTVKVDDLPMPLAHRVRHWLKEWFGQENLLVIDGDDAELKASARGILEPE